jgi:histidine ammonia-lyase
MGTIAARDARSIVELAESIAAIHLIASCQALELRGIEKASSTARSIHELVRSRIDFLDRDRRLDRDIQTAAGLIRSGELADAAGVAARRGVTI